MQMNLWIFGMFVYYFGLTQISFARDTSCGLVWGQSVLISLDSANDVLPELWAQGDTIHVTWRGDENFYKLPYTRSTDGGLTFEQPRDLLQNYPDFLQAPYQKIVANKNKVFLFIAGTSGQGFSPVFLFFSSDAGVNWSQPLQVTNDTTSQLLYASINGDSVLIIYRENYNSSEWKFSLSTDGGSYWYNPQSAVMTWYADKVEIAPDGLLHRVFGDTVNGEVRFTKSSDLGNSWQPSTMLSTNDGNFSSNISIGVNISHYVYTLWKDAKFGCIDIGCSIPMRLSKNSGKSWSEEILLTNQSDGLPAENGKFAIMNNIVGFAWAKTISISNSHIQFRYSLDTGNTWTSICFPTDTSNTEKNLKPKSAISSSGFHIVWYRYTTTGFHIFYRHGSLLTSSPDETNELPKAIVLEQNYPNPFNPQTVIGFSLMAVGNVSLKIYDILGEEVAVIVNEKMEPGEHSAEWNAEGFASGLYFYRLSVTDATGKTSVITKKMVLMK